jgi:hypothetical protein
MSASKRFEREAAGIGRFTFHPRGMNQAFAIQCKAAQLTGNAPLPPAGQLPIGMGRAYP